MVAFLGLIAIAGCIGDRSHDALIQNGTALHITVFPYGQKEAQFRHELGAGESFHENLLTTDTNPSGYVTIVEAVNDTGVVIFCHRYTYGELERLGWQIQLKTGVACG